MDCFGKYISDEVCKDKCVHELRCLEIANVNGPCNCPYKRECHIGRQMIQEGYREEAGDGIEACWYWFDLKHMRGDE